MHNLFATHHYQLMSSRSNFKVILINRLTLISWILKFGKSNAFQFSYYVIKKKVGRYVKCKLLEKFLGVKN